jgi:malate synthase
LIDKTTRVVNLSKPLMVQYPVPKTESQEIVLRRDCVEFIAKLEDKFGAAIEQLLTKRVTVQEKLNLGHKLEFLDETKDIREQSWVINSIPKDLQKRHVEITGPVERKTIINALNSGADVFMADFEDSNSPTWNNIISGQVNLYDAIRREITFYNHAKNKTYKLNRNTATLFVRPRGLHLQEKHFTINDVPIHASLFDFGLYFFNNAKELYLQNRTPAFYLPKLESHEEAKLWSDIFKFSENELGAPEHIIRATVLIETITAAFQMDEILYQLRNYSAGLNCGRWDYIFSFIKKHREDPNFIMPNRTDVTMFKHNMSSYSNLLVKTCHRRKAHAMGGMSAFIPVKNDEVKNAAAINSVRQDKLTEIQNGHDGTWVAHPGLIEPVREIFKESCIEKNQISNTRENINISANDLLMIPAGRKNIDEIVNNIDIALEYMFNWVIGNGCVPINNLMEDAATAEISRTLIWQWVRHNVILDDGTKVTKELITELISDRAMKVEEKLNISNTNIKLYHAVIDILIDACTNVDKFYEFITTPLYELL